MLSRFASGIGCNMKAPASAKVAVPADGPDISPSEWTPAPGEPPESLRITAVSVPSKGELKPLATREMSTAAP